MPDVTPSPVTRIGIAGWGRMGAAMGAHFLSRGLHVAGYDPDPAAAEDIVRSGAARAESPADLGRRSELVLVIVVDDDQVRSVVNGPAGIVAGSEPGTIVAICATVRPATAIEVATEAAAHGVDVVDMGLVGGERAAASASLRIMCGGSEEVIDACREVLAAVASDVCRIGGIGTGQVAKTANNILLWACIRADLEVLRLAKALGVPPNTLRSFMAIGSGANRPLAEWGLHTPRWPKKDLEIALDIAGEAGIDMPFIAALAPLMDEITPEVLHEMK